MRNRITARAKPLSGVFGVRTEKMLLFVSANTMPKHFLTPTAMTTTFTHHGQSKPPNPPASLTESLTDQQLADLCDSQKQEQYHREYLQQQARLACPGCGDDGLAV
jgi:hypothetical protein